MMMMIMTMSLNKVSVIISGVVVVGLCFFNISFIFCHFTCSARSLADGWLAELKSV
jgi:hypothetical protein